MMLVRYLLEYTLETVCHGNRSECARRLGMDYDQLRKIRKRLSEGCGSGRVAEALMTMYCEKGLSIDGVFRQYMQTQLGSDIEEAERFCGELVASARESISIEEHNAQRSEKLMKAVYGLLEQIQRCFCEDLCKRERYQDKACPVKRLVDFTSWLRKEIDELCNPMEEEK